MVTKKKMAKMKKTMTMTKMMMVKKSNVKGDDDMQEASKKWKQIYKKVDIKQGEKDYKNRRINLRQLSVVKEKKESKQWTRSLHNEKDTRYC